MLNVDQITASYGSSQVLFDVSLNVSSGDVCTVIGRNGAGKTTLLRSIVGQLKPNTGQVSWHGQDLTSLQSYQIARKGISFVPEERGLFNDLTVKENLKVSYLNSADDSTFNEKLEWIYDLFPMIEENIAKKCINLSGGQQQLTAIARSLMNDPELILIDEPTEGLSPKPIEQYLEVIKMLKKEGVTVLQVNQNYEIALETSDYGYHLSEGRIVSEGQTSELLGDSEFVDQVVFS